MHRMIEPIWSLWNGDEIVKVTSNTLVSSIAMMDIILRRMEIYKSIQYVFRTGPD